MYEIAKECKIEELPLVVSELWTPTPAYILITLSNVIIYIQLDIVVLTSISI